MRIAITDIQNGTSSIIDGKTLQAAISTNDKVNGYLNGGEVVPFRLATYHDGGSGTAAVFQVVACDDQGIVLGVSELLSPVRNDQQQLSLHSLPFVLLLANGTTAQYALSGFITLSSYESDVSFSLSNQSSSDDESVLWVRKNNTDTTVNSSKSVVIRTTDPLPYDIGQSLTTPPPAYAKQFYSTVLHSPTTTSEGQQTQLFAYFPDGVHYTPQDSVMTKDASGKIVETSAGVVVANALSNGGFSDGIMGDGSLTGEATSATMFDTLVRVEADKRQQQVRVVLYNTQTQKLIGQSPWYCTPSTKSFFLNAEADIELEYADYTVQGKVPLTVVGESSSSCKDSPRDCIGTATVYQNNRVSTPKTRTVSKQRGTTAAPHTSAPLLSVTNSPISPTPIMAYPTAFQSNSVPVYSMTNTPIYSMTNAPVYSMTNSAPNGGSVHASVFRPYATNTIRVPNAGIFSFSSKF